MNNHWFNEGREIINQGRSKKQYESSAIGSFISIIGIAVTFIIILLFG